MIAQSVCDELVNGILDALGGNVLAIVLYGSVARGTEGPDSDIDIAVIVRERIDEWENDRLSDAVVDLDLRYGKVFSVVDIEDGTYREWRNTLPFYRNVEQEGIVLWQAA